jgi:hypothetical protein
MGSETKAGENHFPAILALDLRSMRGHVALPACDDVKDAGIGNLPGIGGDERLWHRESAAGAKVLPLQPASVDGGLTCLIYEHMVMQLHRRTHS